jgi:hypothetical protein
VFSCGFLFICLKGYPQPPFSAASTTQWIKKNNDWPSLRKVMHSSRLSAEINGMFVALYAVYLVLHKKERYYWYYWQAALCSNVYSRPREECSQSDCKNKGVTTSFDMSARPSVCPRGTIKRLPEVFWHGYVLREEGTHCISLHRTHRTL